MQLQKTISTLISSLRITDPDVQAGLKIKGIDNVELEFNVQIRH